MKMVNNDIRCDNMMEKMMKVENRNDLLKIEKWVMGGGGEKEKEEIKEKQVRYP